MENRKIHLGLTGRMGSGKGEFISMLTRRFDFKSISLSDMVREEAARLYRNIDRSTMQDTGNKMRQQEGAGVLGQRICRKISSSIVNKWIIDGIRNPAEITELRHLENFWLVGLSTSPEILIQRIRKRRRHTDIAALEEIKKNLAREWGDGEPPEGQQVGKCLEQADYVIENNGSLKDFKQKIIDLLKELKII